MVCKQMRKKSHRGRKRQGQVIIEFTFCFIIVMFMIYGLMMIFRWSGFDLAFRRIAHDEVLTNSTDPYDQINPAFYRPIRMNAVWGE